MPLCVIVKDEWGQFTVNVAFQKTFKWVYKTTVRQAVTRKEKKRASPGFICGYYFSNLPDDWTPNQYAQASVRGKEITVKDG